MKMVSFSREILIIWGSPPVSLSLLSNKIKEEKSALEQVGELLNS